MILWCDGVHDAAENMRRDAALLAAAEAGAPPVLRLFGFDPPGITLGRNQDAARELDLGRCARDGVAWVNRPTGGRAIFHAEEWTYALTAPRDDPRWGGEPGVAYARTSALLVRSLVRLGVPAALAARRATDALPGPRARGGPAAPCFASTARREIVLEGRKLVGSAQRRTARGLLQQGSVLLGPGHLRLADYVALEPGEGARVREALRIATAAAELWLAGIPPLERWAEALERELSPAPRRIDGPAGLFLLTVPSAGSYTAGSRN